MCDGATHRLAGAQLARGGSPPGDADRDADDQGVRENALRDCAELGEGSCKLSGKRLKPGTCHVVATYSGDANFAAPRCAKKTLKVTKAW